MVTKEMLHAEIDRLTDGQIAEVYRLLRSVSHPVGNGTGTDSSARESEVPPEPARDDDPLGRFDFVRDVGRDFEDWPAADKEIPGMRGMFGKQAAGQATTFAGNPEICLPGAGEGRKEKGLLAALLEIQIDAPEDFAENLDLYASGEKSARDIH